MRIHEWLDKLSKDKNISITQYYGRISGAIQVLQARLECADEEGVSIRSREFLLAEEAEEQA